MTSAEPFLVGAYDYRLVALSVVIAVLASYTAVDLGGRVVAARGAVRLTWLSGGGTAMGVGIWSMQNAGMATASSGPSAAVPDLSHAISISLGIAGIVVVAVMVLGIALLTALVNRLQRQKALLDELFEQAPEAVALLKPDDRVVRANRHFTRVFGYAPPEAVGRRLSELIVPDESREEYRRNADLAARGQRIEEQGVLHRKDGSRVHVGIVRVPVSLPGGRAAVYAMFHDVTERKRAEEHLLARAESILGSVADTHILYDREWRYLYVNEVAVRAIGRPREEILGRSLWEDYPDTIGTEWDRQCHRAMDERVPVTFEFHYPTTDTWWENRLYPIPEGLALFATDITERKRVEAENARLFAQVESARERLQSLSRQLVEAQEEERRRIARELHDEIGQALTALKFNLQSVQRTAGTAVPALDESIDIAERTLQQVRDLSLDLRPSLLDDLGLAAALRWCLDRQGQRTGWRTRFTHDQPEVRVPAHLETVCFRVAQEALTNVARHAQATEVWLDVRRRNGELLLTILDDGVGFDVYAAHRRALGGGSCGVLGMQERVALVGGRLDISSTPASGTGVRMSLPIAAAATQSTAAAEGSS